MKNEYSDKEATKLLKLTEKDIGTLRERIGVGMGGKLNENNITAMRSYIKNIGYTPKKRGRPLKPHPTPALASGVSAFSARKPYQQPCSPLGPDCYEPQKETDEKKPKEVETAQEETQSEPMFFTVERVKELVVEAHKLGYAKGRKDFKIADIGLDELLGAS